MNIIPEVKLMYGQSYKVILVTHLNDIREQKRNRQFRLSTKWLFMLPDMQLLRQF